MPSSLATILIGKDEPLIWHVSEHTHEDCDHTFCTAVTIDQNLSLSGSYEALVKFADTLTQALTSYAIEPRKETATHGHHTSQEGPARTHEIPEVR